MRLEAVCGADGAWRPVMFLCALLRRETRFSDDVIVEQTAAWHGSRYLGSAGMKHARARTAAREPVVLARDALVGDGRAAAFFRRVLPRILDE